jgi:hypothetical protein
MGQWLDVKIPNYYLLVLAFGIASVAGGSPGEVEVATPGTLANKYFVVKNTPRYPTCLYKF